MKKLLKLILPLPAKKQNEMEKRLSEQLSALRNQNDLLLSEIKRLTNHYEQKSIDRDEENTPQKLKEWFFNISGGKELNLESPQSFCEKLNWLKLYDKNPMKVLLADKYLAPKYAKYYTDDGLKTMNIIGYWENAYDIDWGSLPNKFVLKCNHGSSWNVIVKDKSSLNIQETCLKLNNWLSMNYSSFGRSFEWHYANIKPLILAEEFKSNGHKSLVDYKIHCFNGVPKLIEIQTDHYDGHPVSVFYTTSWEKQDISRHGWYDSEDKIDKPEKLEKMLEYAKQLSKEFIYVRIDFYYIKNEIYFGEFTFFPGAGYMAFKEEEHDLKLGEMLHLPIEK